MSSFSASNNSGCTALWSCEFFFCQNKRFLYLLQVPGIDIVIDWPVQHPNDQCTHKKVQEIHSFMLKFFFCPIFTYFLRITLSSSLPFVTQIRGHMARTPFPSPIPRVPSSLIARKKMFRVKFPSLASPCVELVCTHGTYQNNTQHAGCEALSAVSLYTDAFVSG